MERLVVVEKRLAGWTVSWERYKRGWTWRKVLKSKGKFITAEGKLGADMEFKFGEIEGKLGDVELKLGE